MNIDRPMKSAWLAILLLLPALAAAHTYVDSVFADPELDGNIVFDPDGSPHAINTTAGDMLIGDSAETYVVPANAAMRGFFSYTLPEQPSGYIMTNATIRLYQSRSLGNSLIGGECLYPEWDIAGGDTVDCIISHINYGVELWFDDWEKGDFGNPYTFTHNAGIITAEGMSEPHYIYGEQGFRYLDVTSCLQLDYDLENVYSQYRVAFEIETDGDSLTDIITFYTAEVPIHEFRPCLFLTYWDGSAMDDEEIPQTNNIKIFPHPVCDMATLQLQLKQTQQVGIDVYDIRGRRCGDTMQTILSSGPQQLTLDFRNRPSGVYLVRIEADGRACVKTVLHIR